MNSNKECAEYFKSQIVYRRCFEELWKKWRSYGRAAGRITLRDATEEERRAIGGMVGRVFYEEEIRFTVLEFEQGLQKTRFAPVDLKELLEQYFGKTLCSRTEQQKAEATAKDGFWNNIQKNIFGKVNKESAAAKWFSEMLNQKKYCYFILNREYRKDPQQTEILVSHIAAALDLMEAGRQRANSVSEIPLAVFAADISGNPHYFDRGTTAGILLTQAACWLKNTDMPETSYAWRELMQRIGILPDNVSSMVHAYGMRLYRGTEIHPAYDAFCQMRQPCVITMENLCGVTGAKAFGAHVYIVENEMVFSYLVDHLKRSSYQKAGGNEPHLKEDWKEDTREKKERYTLLCTSGQPRAAAQQLIPLLLKSGADIYYSGDIDPDGIRIADRLWRKFGNGIHIWRMSPEDYEKSSSAERIPESGMAKLVNIRHPLLLETAKNVQKKGLAGYQENLLEWLLKDVLDLAFAEENRKKQKETGAWKGKQNEGKTEKTNAFAMQPDADCDWSSIFAARGVQGERNGNTGK